MSQRAAQIAFLVSCASALQIIESLLPNPFPGVRLGLANMLTLVALENLGFAAALEIAVLRTICSALVLGTLFSPAFVISFQAAVVSSVVMGLAYRWLARRSQPWLSLVGVSLLGATAHNLTQLGVVYLYFIHQTSIFWLWPWLGVSAVGMGWLTGIVAMHVSKELRSGPQTAGVTAGGKSLPSLDSAAAATGLRWLPAKFKLALSLAVMAALLIWKAWWLYGSLIAGLLLLCALAGVERRPLVQGLRRVGVFLLGAFLLPVVTESAGAVWLRLGPLSLTTGGLRDGTLYLLRLLALVVNAIWLAQTTSPRELTAGLKKLLAPARRLGLATDRIADTLTLAWLWTPIYLERARDFIRERKLAHITAWRELIPNLAALIAWLYRQAVEEAKAV